MTQAWSDIREPDDRIERGIALINSGRGEAAVAVFNEILTAEPQCKRAIRARGTALRSLGQYDDALRGYNAALSIKPDYARALFNRGLVHFESGGNEFAFQEFRPP
jgi:Flp pilus assembly protein TadD